MSLCPGISLPPLKIFEVTSAVFLIFFVSPRYYSSIVWLMKPSIPCRSAISYIVFWPGRGLAEYHNNIDCNSVWPPYTQKCCTNVVYSRTPLGSMAHSSFISFLTLSQTLEDQSFEDVLMTDDKLVECLRHTPKLTRLAVEDANISPLLTDKLLIALQSHQHCLARSNGVVPMLKFLELRRYIHIWRPEFNRRCKVAVGSAFGRRVQTSMPSRFTCYLYW